MNNFHLLILLPLLMGFLQPPRKLTIYMIGDSTMADKRVTAYPETGWGTPFRYFWDSLTVVDNRAQNGRSTKSFREEGLWKGVQSTLQPGDYVIIEFGHNDEVPTKKNATKPDEFQKNLETYIAETRAAGAIPILMTPVSRRNFDSTGNFRPTHEQYSAIVRNVAKSTGVYFIDMDLKSQALLKSLGAAQSSLLFNQLQPREHPHFPNGIIDNTHFNELGARLMAQLALQGIRELQLPLLDHLYQPPVKK